MHRAAASSGPRVSVNGLRDCDARREEGDVGGVMDTAGSSLSIAKGLEI